MWDRWAVTEARSWSVADRRVIDTMLTKSKFKDFFQKNIAAL